MRTIDADAIPYVEAVDGDTFEGTGKLYARKEDIDALPTIEERKTGKWIEKDVFYIDDADDANVIDAWQSAKCSVCGKYHTTPYLYSFDNFNYCPNCGSAMTEGEQP